MDRELSEQTIRNRRSKNFLSIIVLLLIISLGIFAIRGFLQGSIKASKIRTAVAELGSIQNTITASGEVVPEFEQVLSSPIRAAIKKVILNVGSEVRTNQAILELDKEFAQLDYEKLGDQLELKKNSIVQLDLQLEKNLYDLEINNQIKQLRIDALKADLENAKKLASVGGGTQENIDKAALNLQIAELEKKQLENDLAYKRSSITSDLKELELQAAIQEKALKEFSRKMEQADLLATRDGVLTWVNENIGTTVSEGEPLVRIADLGSFRVEGAISDIYADRIALGQEVFIRINETDLKGSIYNIKPTVKNGIINFDIRLEAQDHDLLRPNQQVEVFLITASKSKALIVENGPIFKGRKQQYLFIKEGNIAKRRKVNVGLSNFDHVEVLDNLDAGEEVILTDMKDYEHLEEVKINN